MNVKNFIPAVLAVLGIEKFSEVEGKKVLTPEERATLSGYGFNERFMADLEKEINAEPAEAGKPKNREQAVIAAVLGQTSRELEERTADMQRLASDNEATHAELVRAQARIDELNARIAELSDMAESDPGARAGRAGNAPATINLGDEQQLGGLPGEMFALNRPYNVRARAALLAREGRHIEVHAASSIDYSTLRDDLGAFYRQTWRERLQSFLITLPSLESVFPLESGYQDLATLVNVWLGEFSQADNTIDSDFDNVAKGSYEFGHETLRMYSVMFSHKFRNLKEIERLWIGSLNKEGSKVIKWSFIEYLLAETAKKLHNEREQRRVNGVRKNPVANERGTAMGAADGFYETIRKWIEGRIDVTPDGGTNGQVVFQIKPFELGEITPGNIGEIFYKGTSLVPGTVRDTGSLRLYVPSHLIPWYHKYLETNYGTNRDYTPNEMYVHEFPSVRIVPIPNADNHFRIVWSLEGNIKCYEQAAGEMLNFQMEQQDWSLKVWSNWKESIWAEAVGYKYTNRDAMDGSRQLIWANEYDRPASFFLPMEPGANPSALLHSSILTAGTTAYAITDIEDAQVGQAVTLKAGTDKVTIAKSGKFASLTAAWEPNVGDVLVVMKRTDGSFVEVSREKAATDTAYAFAADDTTPSVDGATVFVTDENTAATAITNFDDAVVGTVYTIYGAGSANASTIANGGNFVLTTAITLSEGKFIKVVKSSDGKFYELARG